MIVARRHRAGCALQWPMTIRAIEIWLGQAGRQAGGQTGSDSPVVSESRARSDMDCTTKTLRLRREMEPLGAKWKRHAQWTNIFTSSFWLPQFHACPEWVCVWSVCVERSSISVSRQQCVQNGSTICDLRSARFTDPTTHRAILPCLGKSLINRLQPLSLSLSVTHVAHTAAAQQDTLAYRPCPLAVQGNRN